ncbi:MAG: hypothetical protein KME32_35805 [Mojavia pulchra JT2-VF2]|jgi:hypothetical protein|uniref:Uncharacterized protein n=1 Tax=Mojavia pulchra JT2-VF2 TaxID=287848 RepID=A0A951UJX0_9NOST|nr:hypothetical protein [Mojavia pulchra JT2-VF2]
MDLYNLRSRNSTSALPASKNALSTFRSKCKRCLRQAASRLRSALARLIQVLQQQKRQ